MSEALLSVRDLSVRYPDRRRLRVGSPAPRAVDSVTFDVVRGETLALVGESGSGKTTTARAVMRLIEPESGSVLFDGKELLGLRGEVLRRHRRRMQMVFQDPYTSLNPRLTVGEAIGEGLLVHGLASGPELARRVGAVLREVELDPDDAGRYPHELSGGQRQRVAIARAIVVDPELLVLDEAVSSLDVTTQARILALLGQLRERRGLTTLFIAHNLAVVQQVADRVAVLFEGRLVELSPTQSLFDEPRHPHTRALIEAVPQPDPAGFRSKSGAARRSAQVPGAAESPPAH